MNRILLTCPPMINQSKRYDELYKKHNLEIVIPNFTQTLTEDELCDLLPNFDGWIIGDDPATRRVFEAGIKGKLKAAVKWGVGVDNVDFEACKELNIPIDNIPGVFGEEVSDVALGYLLCLTRGLHLINKKHENNEWYKPSGNTLTNKKVCLVGFGDIGRCVARKLLAFNLDVHVSDPGFIYQDDKIVCKYNKNLSINPILQNVKLDNLDNCIKDTDYIISTCPLNKFTHHLINKENILKSKKGVKIINVGRGPVICEKSVIELLEEGFIDSVGFDVFEEEPLSKDNKLRNFKKNIFGSHNGSNTIEAVDRVSKIAVEKICKFLS